MSSASRGVTSSVPSVRCQSELPVSSPVSLLVALALVTPRRSAVRRRHRRGGHRIAPRRRRVVRKQRRVGRRGRFAHDRRAGDTGNHSDDRNQGSPDAPHGFLGTSRVVGRSDRKRHMRRTPGHPLHYLRFPHRRFSFSTQPLPLLLTTLELLRYCINCLSLAGSYSNQWIVIFKL